MEIYSKLILIFQSPFVSQETCLCPLDVAKALILEFSNIFFLKKSGRNNLECLLLRYWRSMNAHGYCRHYSVP